MRRHEPGERGVDGSGEDDNADKLEERRPTKAASLLGERSHLLGTQRTYKKSPHIERVLGQ